MNDTTLPIPPKKNPRHRPADRPRAGFGLRDWLTLLRHAKDLPQRRGAPVRRGIPLAEVRAHDKPHDGWMALRGRVYNITPYLAYHPGGSDIVERCMGRDATKLFDRYHSWVNVDGLIGPLLLGYLMVEPMEGVGEIDESGGSSSDDDCGDGTSATVVPPPAVLTAAPTPNSSGFAMPRPRPPEGKPMTSLLPCGGEDDNEDDALLI